MGPAIMERHMKNLLAVLCLVSLAAACKKATPPAPHREPRRYDTPGRQRPAGSRAAGNRTGRAR